MSSGDAVQLTPERAALLIEMARLLASPENRSSLDPQTLFASACERMVAGGLPLRRVSSSLATMHPEVESAELVWWRGEGTQMRSLPHEVMESPAFRGSPIEWAFQTRAPLRCRLDDPGRPSPYPQLAPLVAKGCTDYLVQPFQLIDGRMNAISFATDRPGGFTELDLAFFEAALPLFTLRLDLGFLDYSLRSLLRVYLGSNAAHRVLEGAFRRGKGESLTAAIWYCDMRGFTALTDDTPPAEVVAVLDHYFEAVGGAVEGQGGEILKFVGDAVLAVFEVGSDGPTEPCRRALQAARTAREQLAQLNERRREAQQRPIDMGIALHLGEVTYGNIGARERLDFTIIGRHVNETARLEAKCKELGRPLLVSDAFARALGLDGFASLGLHTLRGLSSPVEIFEPKA